MRSVSLKDACICAAFVAAISAPTTSALAQRVKDETGNLYLENLWAYAYDSNIYSNSAEIDDRVQVYAPRLHYDRSAGVIHVEGSAGVQIVRFDQNTNENTEDIKTRLQVSFPHRESTPLKARIRTSWNEVSEANADLGTRIQSQEFQLGADVTYDFTNPFAVRVRPGYKKEHFVTSGYLDNESYTNRTELLYHYSDDLDLLVGHRYRRAYVEDYDRATFTPASPLRNEEDVDTVDNTVYVGAVGQVLPKVLLIANVGVQRRTFPDRPQREEREAIFGDIEAQWNFSDKTTFFFRALRDLETTPSGLESTETLFAAEVEHLWNRKVTSTLGAEYEINEFSSQSGSDSKDIGYTVFARTSVRFNETFSVFGQVDHYIRESDLASLSYERTIIQGGVLLYF